MQHDSSYKKLFRNPEMIRDLISGFVDEAWVADVDFGSLEHVSGSYVTDDLRDREDDIIWRVKIDGQMVYVYILLEFQSSVDKYMAVRIMSYLALLYQDLITTKMIAENGKLPPVFPIVLYNGKDKWRAKRDIIHLIERLPGGLGAYAPQLRYFLLEINAVDESAQFALKNLAAALIRLEKSGESDAMFKAMLALADWVKGPKQTRLRRAFNVWLKRVLLTARLPGVGHHEFEDILEDGTMLAERVIEWTQKWKAEGWQEGRQEGQQEGKTELLQKQLERRFGPLPAWALIRLREGGPAEIENWSFRILEPMSLPEILN